MVAQRAGRFPGGKGGDGVFDRDVIDEIRASQLYTWPTHVETLAARVVGVCEKSPNKVPRHSRTMDTWHAIYGSSCKCRKMWDVKSEKIFTSKKKKKKGQKIFSFKYAYVAFLKKLDGSMYV